MPNAETEILIQVENLPLCRAFYRDALMLGNPEIDSNFLCRFRLADGRPSRSNRSPGEQPRTPSGPGNRMIRSSYSKTSGHSAINSKKQPRHSVQSGFFRIPNQTPCC